MSAKAAWRAKAPQIVAAYRHGAKTRVIYERYGITPSALYTLLHEQQVPLRGRATKSRERSGRPRGNWRLGHDGRTSPVPPGADDRNGFST